MRIRPLRPAAKALHSFWGTRAAQVEELEALLRHQVPGPWVRVDSAIPGQIESGGLRFFSELGFFSLGSRGEAWRLCG